MSAKDLKRFNAGRLTALSDGVFAVALTLLVLGIVPPDTDSAHLSHALVSKLPLFGIFAISFAIVAYHWVVHHLIFSLVKIVDVHFIWLNLLFLFAVVILPFSAGVLGRYPIAPVALILYGTNVAFCSVTLMLVWWQMLRARLNTEIRAEIARYISLRFTIWLVLSVVGIALALILPIASLALFAALPLLYACTSRPPKSA
jgi:uncharacterized membrane protein